LASLLAWNEKKKLWFCVSGFVGDVMNWIGLVLFGWGYWLRAPTAEWKYFAQVFIGNLATIWDFWAFD